MQSCFSMNEIIAQPMTRDAFAPYGEVLELGAGEIIGINQGNCERHHNQAKLSFGEGDAGISLFLAKLRDLPYELEMMERHPLGSQSFIPMCQNGFLVTVADDENGIPVNPRAFITEIGQGINFHPNTWHGVLTPLKGSGMFCVVDRIGDGNNLQEHWLDQKITIK